MSNVKNIDSNKMSDKKLEEEAFAWIAKIDSGDMTKRDDATLKEWMARSPRHKSELFYMSKVWDGLDDLWNEDVLLNNAQPTNNKSRWTKAKYATGIAATVMLAFVGTFLLNEPLNAPNQNDFYTTKVGAQKTIDLDDGSKVILNTASQIEIFYSENERKVRLLKGEAMFNVAKDKTRPFLVYAGTGVVRAVGTTFAVQLHEENIEVTVTEGQVELSTYVEGDNNGEFDVYGVAQNETLILAHLDAGQRAEFRSEIDILEFIKIPVLEQQLAWQTGQIIFDGETLETVLEDISRYTELEFVISDTELKQLEISGFFLTDNIQVFITSLESGFNIDVKKTDDGKVYLSRRTNK